MGLDGVEIFTNGSGSHHELRKLHKRINLMLSATAKLGGVYMYSNLIGCDGERVYYDGCCLIAVNGEVSMREMRENIYRPISELLVQTQSGVNFGWHLGSLPYLCTKNETMASLHVATLTVQRELPEHVHYLVFTRHAAGGTRVTVHFGRGGSHHSHYRSG